MGSISVYTYIYMCVNMYVCMCVYVYMYIYIYLYIYIFMYIYIYIYIYICVCVCVCVCITSANLPPAAGLELRSRPLRFLQAVGRACGHHHRDARPLSRGGRVPLLTRGSVARSESSSSNPQGSEAASCCLSWPALPPRCVWGGGGGVIYAKCARVCIPPAEGGCSTCALC